MSPDHRHAGFEIPAGHTDPLGRPVDHDLLGQFVGAAFDGCASCQDALLTLLVADPVTTGRLVELACVATDTVFGGLPSNLTDPGVPGPAAPEFRRLARLGVDGGNNAMFAECERMNPQRAAGGGQHGRRHHHRPPVRVAVRRNRVVTDE